MKPLPARPVEPLRHGIPNARCAARRSRDCGAFTPSRGTGSLALCRFLDLCLLCGVPQPSSPEGGSQPDNDDQGYPSRVRNRHCWKRRPSISVQDSDACLRSSERLLTSSVSPALGAPRIGFCGRIGGGSHELTFEPQRAPAFWGSKRMSLWSQQGATSSQHQQCVALL